MLTRSLALSLFLVLTAGSAWAQSSSLSPRSSVPPAGAGAGFLSRQTSDQWLATRFIGQTVFGTDGNPMGTIRDLVLDRDATIAGVVIAVMGPDGTGDKTIGVPFKSLQATRASNNEERFVLQVTRSDLRTAPEFAHSDSTATTGGGGNGSSK